MARLDLDDLPPRIANLLLGLDEGAELLIVQHGGLLRRMIVQTQAPAVGTPPVAPAEPAPAPPPSEPLAEPTTKMMRSPVPAAEQPTAAKPPKQEPAKAEPLPPPPISSPAVEQQTRDIFENFRAAIEDEF